MTPSEYLAAVTSSLAANAKARALWELTGQQRWMNPDWTTEMTLALGEAAHAELGAFVAGKGIDRRFTFADPHGRREYLALDLTVHDNSWRQPLLIVEHENSANPEKIQYCAWKLGMVAAQYRILIAYYDSRQTYEGYESNADALWTIIEPVVKETGVPIAIIAGDWSAAWGNIFTIVPTIAG